jgi:outer membrane protein assembly factor BamB
MPTRRSFVRSSAAAIACLAVARRSRPAQAAPADAWPQFRGGPRLTGVSASPAPPLRLLWTHDAGGEGVESSAAIVGGRVYVGSQAGRLLALELRTGERIWAYEGGAEIGESSPCVSGGVAYVGDLAGVVHAVDVGTGKAAWTRKTGSEIRASPVVAGGCVLLG